MKNYDILSLDTLRISQQALHLPDGLIAFKESILREVSCGGLFTVNYPLLIRHITREANHYIRILECGTHERGIRNGTA